MGLSGCVPLGARSSEETGGRTKGPAAAVLTASRGDACRRTSTRRNAVLVAAQAAVSGGPRVRHGLVRDRDRRCARDTTRHREEPTPPGPSATTRGAWNMTDPIINVVKNEVERVPFAHGDFDACLLYTSPSPRDRTRSRMPSSA